VLAAEVDIAAEELLVVARTVEEDADVACVLAAAVLLELEDARTDEELDVEACAVVVLAAAVLLELEDARVVEVEVVERATEEVLEVACVVDVVARAVVVEVAARVEEELEEAVLDPRKLQQRVGREAS
jgi:hypothetical protein